jgi:hypothetical protein
MVGVVFIVVVLWALWAVGGGAITEHKGRGWGLGIALGLVLGLIGVIICLCLPRDEVALARRQAQRNFLVAQQMSGQWNSGQAWAPPAPMAPATMACPGCRATVPRAAYCSKCGQAG